MFLPLLQLRAKTMKYPHNLIRNVRSGVNFQKPLVTKNIEITDQARIRLNLIYLTVFIDYITVHNQNNSRLFTLYSINNTGELPRSRLVVELNRNVFDLPIAPDFKLYFLPGKLDISLHVISDGKHVFPVHFQNHVAL